jgi:hypothetical protein
MSKFPLTVQQESKPASEYMKPFPVKTVTQMPPDDFEASVLRISVAGTGSS